MKCSRSKGQSVVNVVIYFAISAAVISILLVYSSGMFKDMRSAVAVDQATNALQELNKKIHEVARGGLGSRRSMTLSIQDGEFNIDGDRNKITYLLLTNADIVSPRTTVNKGGVVIGSNAETDAFECPSSAASLCNEISYVCNSTDSCFVMDNKHLRVVLEKWGSISSPVTINNTDVIREVYIKETAEKINPKLNIRIDNENSSTSGTGYTYLKSAGYDMGRGEMHFYLNSSYKVIYEMAIILESEADFISIESVSSQTA